MRLRSVISRYCVAPPGVRTLQAPGGHFFDQPLAERTIITFFIIEVLPFEKQSCLPDNPSRYSVPLADHLILTIHGYEPALRVAVYNELHSTHPLLCAVEVAAPKAAD